MSSVLKRKKKTMESLGYTKKELAYIENLCIADGMGNIHEKELNNGRY